jgi:hypothetical protein
VLLYVPQLGKKTGGVRRDRSTGDVYYVPGRKYVLHRAETRRKSFRMLDIQSGTSARPTTRAYKRVLEMGIVDA